MNATCTHIEYGSCMSIKMDEEPDMRLGDICLLCACHECERCGELIDLDCEHQVKCEGDMYVDICEACLQDSDILYDDELEVERREEMALAELNATRGDAEAEAEAREGTGLV